jgi:hypothetical protein
MDGCVGRTACFDKVLKDIFAVLQQVLPVTVPTNVTYLTVRRNAHNDSPIINNMRPR